MSLTTASNVSWNLLSQWLEDCLTTHINCRTAEQQGTFYPTRLLNIGDSAESNITLCETTGSELVGPYIALSHCWGTSRNLILVDDSESPVDGANNPISLQTAKGGIPWEKLPKTYEDAIKAARRLAVRYVWIDSLCILQNSSEDWMAEAAKMDRIYSNAFCTFAAAGAKDGRGGLFHPRNPSLVQPVIVCPCWEETAQQSFVLIPPDFWKDAASESFLAHRAWALQERILSPRVIHFGQNQILWECRSHDCCETFPFGLPKVARDMHTRFKGLDPDTDGALLRRKEPANDDVNTHGDEEDDASLNGYYLWSRILEKYCRTQLTFEKDKLVAIFGLAKYMQTLLDDRYVAGLWHNILPSQLLWRVEEFTPPNVFDFAALRNPPNPPSSYPAKWTAPTWSWASVNGSITTPRPFKDSSLIKYQVFDPDEDNGPSFGTHARIAVAGDLYFAHIGYHPAFGRSMLFINPRGLRMRRPPGPDWADIPFYPDFKDIEEAGSTRATEVEGREAEDDNDDDEEEEEANVPWPPSDPQNVVIAIAYPDVPLPAADGELFPVFCLPLVDTKQGGKRALQSELPVGHDGISGLILMPRVPLGGMYMRIGCFDVLRNDTQGRVRGLGKEYCDGKVFRRLFRSVDQDFVVLI